MKKLLAFVLVFAVTFSTIGHIDGFAARLSDEVQVLVDIGMLVGDGGGVTEEYVQKEMDRLTAAISILKLKGLYEEALRYRGTRNFTDKDEVKWPEGRNIMAYLKDNPEIGFIGDDKGRFLPYAKIDEQSYFKVLLETLGYKQIRSGEGDFHWEDTLEFASRIGLKPSYKKVFTIDLLAKATVSALKAKTKDGVRYINILIEKEAVKKSRAIAAGLLNSLTDVKIKSAKAVGNTVVEVVFEEDISYYDVEDLYNYEISGLNIKRAYLVRKDAIRLETSAQSSGKLYTLTVGDVKVKFTGVAKISGSPQIRTVKSEDIETVVVEFDKELDYYSATDVSNYSISGVKIRDAELEGKKVTLTTQGLQARKQYTLKVTNIKSVDGSNLRSSSKSFYTRPDTTAPRLKDVKAETNQRVVVRFTEPVTKESAEDLRNYYITSSNGELEIWDAKLVGEDEYTVELTTEPQKASTKYELTVQNIVDKTKAANKMERHARKTFYGMREDKSAPVMLKDQLKVLSRNHIQVVFSDSSRLVEETVLDANNYEVVNNNKYKDSIYVESVEKISYSGGKYKVMLRVEDLEINSSYTVTAYNIEDEFGNVLEKNNSGTVRASRDDFAAATVEKYNVISGNKLEIHFTKPLNKESAGDISNYEINNGIGTPIEAKYEDCVVTLETAEMIEGKVYRVYIDGVYDMMDNRLKLSFEFRARAGEDDEESPKLEYVYAVNKYVVAAVFDEPVLYKEGTTALVLRSNKDEVILYAKALTDDDTTIEFSNLKEGEYLKEGVLYTVVKADSKGQIKSLEDVEDRTVNRNKFDRSDLDDYDFDLYGTSDEPERPEILYIAQRDGKTFEMEMSKEVVVINKVVKTIGSPSATFEAKVEGENNSIVTFTITSHKYIDGDKDYKIDVEKIITDRHGIKAENIYNGYTLLYGEYKDEDNPYIVDVTAIDRMTVVIEYSENIGYEGRYTIKNTDDTAKYKTIGYSLKEIDNNKVILSLSQPLEGRYEYVLIIEAPAKDLVGNVSEERKGDEFYFQGTDLAPVKVPDIKEQEDKAAARKVEDMISNLPKNINLSHKDEIQSVAEAYNALTANQKKYVTNYDKLVAAQEEIERLEKIEEDKKKAEKVENLIDKLPSVERIDLDDKEAVESAREAYDNLTIQQKAYVKNLEKLEAAEAKIKQLEEEKRKEKARRELEEAAMKAVEDFEAMVNDEEWSSKIAALSKAVDDLNKAMNEFFQDEEKKPETAMGSVVIIDGEKEKDEKRIKLDKAFEAANKAANEAEELVKSASGFEEKAMEAYNKMNDGDFKTAMAARIRTAKSKVNEMAEKIAELKETIPNLQDVLDVKEAKNWLTVDKFNFDKENNEVSESPIIYTASKHQNQTVYKYSVVENNKADSVRRMNIFSRINRNKPGSVKIEEKKMILNTDKGRREVLAEDKTTLIINRGTENTEVMIKVEITKGKVTTDKYFKINIPKLDDDFLPVTISEAEPPGMVLGGSVNFLNLRMFQ